MASYGDWELALDALVQARQGSRAAPGLKTLLAAEGLAAEGLAAEGLSAEGPS